MTHDTSDIRIVRRSVQPDGSSRYAVEFDAGRRRYTVFFGTAPPDVFWTGEAIRRRAVAGEPLGVPYWCEEVPR